MPIFDARGEHSQAIAVSQMLLARSAVFGVNWSTGSFPTPGNGVLRVVLGEVRQLPFRVACCHTVMPG
jgi:hypothetical protein